MEECLHVVVGADTVGEDEGQPDVLDAVLVSARRLAFPAHEIEEVMFSQEIELGRESRIDLLEDVATELDQFLFGFEGPVWRSSIDIDFEVPGPEFFEAEGLLAFVM